MSLKALSLGAASAAAAGITISGSTNATPIVVTFGDGHGLKDGDRIAVAGVTGNTGANGMWTLQFTGENTARLLGSVGNGAHGGTVRVGVMCDASPFLPNHSAVLAIVGNLVGTLAVEEYANYDDFAAGTNAAGSNFPALTGSDVTNTAGNSSTTPASTSIAMTAADAGREIEVKLGRIMRAVVSAYTSGTVRPVLKA